ncbi:sortase B [Lachnospiraceae bacterium PF1-22]
MKDIIKNTIYSLLLFFCVLIVGVCAYLLVSKVTVYKEDRDKYEQTLVEYTNNEATENSAEEFTVDFDGLRAINPDVVAWIRFENPAVISYPVVQAPENQSYLYRSWDGSWNYAGAIFLNAHNANDFSDFNTTIYGHRMNDGSMFDELKQFRNQDFVNQNKYFTVYLLDGTKNTYEIFAMGEVYDASSAYYTNFDEDEEKESYIAERRSNSVIQTDTQVGSSDKIVSLSTCTNHDGSKRWYLQGKLIKETKIVK